MNAIDPPGSAWLWTVRGLAAAAAAIAVYLWLTSLRQGALPAGCGGGSGCAAVLASRWSHVAGVPVSAPAAAVYLGVLAATFALRSPHAARRRAAWVAALALTALAAAAAVGFVAVQLLVLRAICPWCMADHALGLALAITVWARAPIGREGASAPTRATAAAIAAAAVVLTVAVLAAQATQGERFAAPLVTDAPGGSEGEGEARELVLLDGRLRLPPHAQPIIGSADAEHVLAALFDYCCPHCRATHAQLTAAVERYGPRRLGVILLPAPRDADCNPTIEETEPRFEHACELARLAMAVWRAEPASFEAYDRWLFEPVSPRGPAEARAHAATLVGEDRLAAALADPWVDEQIARGVRAYIDSGADRIPVLIGPGLGIVVGRPESEAALAEMLEERVGVAAGDDR